MFLIIDCETSGLPLWNQPFTNKYQPRVCQLACMLLDREFKELNSFCCLIQSDGWVISEDAYTRHGITQEVCERYGLPITIVLSLFEQLMQKADYIVAHNLKFDLFLMNIELANAQKQLFDWETQGICTMLASTEFCRLPGKYGKYKWPKLEEVFKIITGEEHDKVHDALGDCRATAIVFGYLVQQKIINLDEFKTIVNN